MKTTSVHFENDMIVVTMNKQEAARAIAQLAVQMSRLEGIDSHDPLLPSGSCNIRCVDESGKVVTIHLSVDGGRLHPRR